MTWIVKRVARHELRYTPVMLLAGFVEYEEWLFSCLQKYNHAVTDWNRKKKRVNTMPQK